jgi:hypothetical protein
MENHAKKETNNDQSARYHFFTLKHYICYWFPSPVSSRLTGRGNPVLHACSQVRRQLALLLTYGRIIRFKIDHFDDLTGEVIGYFKGAGLLVLAPFPKKKSD